MIRILQEIYFDIETRNQQGKEVYNSADNTEKDKGMENGCIWQNYNLQDSKSFHFILYCTLSLVLIVT